MINIEHDYDASLDDFMAKWRRITADDTAGQYLTAFVLIGLTNFGKRPLQSTRLAEVLGLSVSEVEARLQGGWPGTGVEDGLITVNPERAPSAPRRHIQIGGRRFGVTGCAPDVFLYAPLVRPSLQLEETCPATGTPIRIIFTPQQCRNRRPQRRGRGDAPPARA